MIRDLQKIAVIGSGTMGSAIAGQIANAGREVMLLDLPSDGEDANAVAKQAVERLLKSDPPALMHKKRSELISVGNIRDDFSKLAECDWIIEAVVERLDIKKAFISGWMRPSRMIALSHQTHQQFQSNCLWKICHLLSKHDLRLHIISIQFVICVCWSLCAASKLTKRS